MIEKVTCPGQRVPYGAQATGCPRATGFSLVELAIVLVIIGLLLGAAVIPLSSQMERNRRNETRQQIEDIVDALIGYAVINKHLPCPDFNGNGLDDDHCAGGPGRFYSGPLPGAALGVKTRDAWGRPLTYVVNGAFTATLQLSSSGTGSGRLGIAERPGCGSRRVADDVPAILLSTAKQRYPSRLERENVDHDNCFVTTGYSLRTGAEFDDLLGWVSRQILIDRLAASGQLP